MQTRAYIHAMLSYIEDHLSEDLKPESIAGGHFISVSQLYRDFYAFTGHSVKEYIRKRRISNACEKIKCSELPLTVIADESGYQTIQAFYKQFRSTVGMTPLEYRRNDSYFYFYPFVLDEMSLAIKVGMETIPPCNTMRFYDYCLTGIEDRALAAAGEISGRVFGRNGKQVGSRLCYEVMTEKPGEGNTDLYATCTVNYKESEINDGWNYLYHNWLSASMFEKSGDRYFEEYLFQNGKPRKLKLYLPVKKRKTEQHITITTEPERTFIAAKESGYNAERKASEKVVSFLQEHHPLLIRHAQNFYVCIYDSVYACGLECGGGFRITALPEQHMNSGVSLIQMPAGRYAVLPDDCFGDIRIGSEKMDLWLKKNAILHEDEPVFAVYTILNGRYDNEHIQMRLYKRLKNDKNG